LSFFSFEFETIPNGLVSNAVKKSEFMELFEPCNKPDLRRAVLQR